MALGEVLKLSDLKKENLSNKDIIEFKGSKSGLIINIKEKCDFLTIKDQLIHKMDSAQKFFKGAKISAINCTFLNDIEILEIRECLSSNFGIEFKEEERDTVFQGIYEGNAKFIKNTLRSGMKVDYQGNVVVIGDINPGGQVVADGNIIIMGHLRGTVHAGANGNKDAVVVAFNLEPMQIRIGDIIGIAPEENIQKPSCPEIAYVKDNCIIIEPYLSRK